VHPVTGLSKKEGYGWDVRASSARGVGHQHIPFLQVLTMQIHLVLDRTFRSRNQPNIFNLFLRTYKLMDPKWIGIYGAFATKSPSGPNNAHEKSSRSLMLVLIEVCCNDRPIASATLINRFANKVKRIGSGPAFVENSDMLAVSIDDGPHVLHARRVPHPTSLQSTWNAKAGAEG
jgi:hypothetical protein